MTDISDASICPVGYAAADTGVVSANGILGHVCRLVKRFVEKVEDLRQVAKALGQRTPAERECFPLTESHDQRGKEDGGLRQASGTPRDVPEHHAHGKCYHSGRT